MANTSRWLFGGPTPDVVSTADLEYIRVRVTATTSGQPYNPTADTVQMAFVAPRTAPSQNDWHLSAWDVDSVTAPLPIYWIVCLVGPSSGADDLAPERWDVWVRVFDNPETIVRMAGSLTVTV